MSNPVWLKKYLTMKPEEAIKYNNDDLPTRDIEYFKQHDSNRTIITITG